jgi:Small-conductance mechanosensitive channel
MRPPPELLPLQVQTPVVEYLLAAGVLLATVLLVRYGGRLLEIPVEQQFDRQSVQATVTRVLKIGMVAAGLVLALSVIGVDLGNVVLSVTVFSAVLGLVLAPIVAAIINGLFILMDQPYEIGDMVELDDGRRGFIDNMTIRYTKIITLENTFLVIPNSVIRERLVTNYSAEDPRTRLTLRFGLTYDSDIDRARELIQRTAASVDGVIEGGPAIRIRAARYPAVPTVLLREFGDSGIILELWCWVERPFQLIGTTSAINEAVRTAFHADPAHLEFAFPHRHLKFDDRRVPDAAQQRLPLDDES